MSFDSPVKWKLRLGSEHLVQQWGGHTRKVLTAKIILQIGMNKTYQTQSINNTIYHMCFSTGNAH